MKMTTLALAAGLGLAASAASAVTVDTISVGFGSGFGTETFTLASDGEYTFTTNLSGFSIALFQGFGAPVAAGADPLTATLVAGTYAAVLTNTAYTGQSVDLTISAPDTPAVPLPASAPLLALALGGAGFVARRSMKKAA